MFGVAHHQFWHRLLGVHALEEHEAQLFSNGHFYSIASRQLQGCFSVGDAFGDTVHRREDGIEFFTGGEAPSQLLVAAQGAGTGSNEVTNACQAGKCEGVGARSDAQAGNLGQTTCHKCGLGIVPIAHTIVETSANSDDILQRATKLDTYEITGRIDAKPHCVEQGASMVRDIPFNGGYNRGRRFSFRPFLSNSRPLRGYDTALRTRNFFANDLGHAFEAANFNTFTGIHKQGFTANMGGKEMDIFAHALRWCDKQEHLLALDGLGYIRCHTKRYGEVYTGEKFDVLALLLHSDGALRLIVPERGRDTFFRQQKSQCGTPGPAADDTNRYHCSIS